MIFFAALKSISFYGTHQLCDDCALKHRTLSMSDYGLQDHGSRILAQIDDMPELYTDELEDDPLADSGSDTDQIVIVDNDIEIVDKSVGTGTTMVPNFGEQGSIFFI